MSVPAADGTSTGKSARRPKAPGAAAILTTFCLALLVAITGITSRTAPPPTVAQFAPQAVKQIKSAPKDQSSRFGSGAGTGEGGTGAGEGSGEGLGGGVASPSPSAPGVSPPAVPVDPIAVTRRCVGDPPRQIEDTQSPPCVPFWQGANGGATWKGVTADEIRIAVPQAPKADAAREVEALENFFNRRFEFYGRKLVLERPDLTQSDVPEDQRNDAAKVDSLNFFGSLGYSYNYYYAAELARRKIISVTSEPYYTDKTLREFAPYVWQYSMGLDNMLENIGAWSCNRLANRPASHAGDPTMTTGSERVFGIVGYNIYPEMPLDLSPLEKRLEGCGSEVAYVVNNSTVGTASSPTDAQNTAIQLKDAGVTSVICLCNSFQLPSLFRGATAQRYFPEWLTSTYSLNDSDYVIHQFNNDQTHLDHTFGLTFQPRELRPENTPATWAVKEGSGRPDTPASQTSANMYQRRNLYHDLLMMASGIQMAGPILTPKTFEAGLQRAVFPNPIEPSMQGTVNFLGDYSMTDDVGEYYWSSRAVSPYAEMSGQGAFCYVDKGRRHTVTTWPKTEPPLGQVPCDSRDQ